jgi:hypothetical protein
LEEALNLSSERILNDDISTNGYVKNFRNNNIQKLEQHLESNNILTTEQFDFRKGVHTENAVFSLTKNIITSLNQRQQVI